MSDIIRQVLSVSVGLTHKGSSYPESQIREIHDVAATLQLLDRDDSASLALDLAQALRDAAESMRNYNAEVAAQLEAEATTDPNEVPF